MSVVFTIALNNYDREYADCIETQAAYCRRHGYRHWVINSTPWRLTARQTAWLKVIVLRHLLEAGHKEVAFVDADCEVRRHAPPFIEAITPGKSLMLAPGKSGRLNSGVIFARAGEDAVGFLSTLMRNADKPVPKEFSTRFENGHFIYYGRESECIGKLDHRLWNNNSVFDEGSYIQHYSEGVMRQHRKGAPKPPADQAAGDGKDLTGLTIRQYSTVAKKWAAEVAPLPPRPSMAARAIGRVRLAARVLIEGDAAIRSKEATTAPIRKSRVAKTPAEPAPPAPIFNGDNMALYHWAREGISNFGDEISPLIVKRLLANRGAGQIEIVPPERGRRKLLAVGSVLQYAGAGDVVWGSGVNGKTWIRNLGPETGLDVRCVRGPLTRRALVQAGVACPEVYGDPGHLFVKIFEKEIAEVATESSSRILYIPNVSDELFGPQVTLPDEVRYVSPTETPFRIAKMISEADLVVSSSLHGIVFADSLGVKCRPLASWFEPPFKYQDYLLGTGRAGVRFSATLDEALEAPDLPQTSIDVTAILNSFPPDLVTASSARH